MQTDFSAALRAAITVSGRSLHALAAELRARGTPASVSTLSSWQTGENHPERAQSLAALASLEELLAVPPRSLLTLLPPRRPRGRWRPPASTTLPHQRMWRSPAAVQRVLAKLDATPEDLYLPARISRTATAYVDADGHETHMRHRQLLRGDRDRADRVIVLIRYESLPQPPTVYAAEGCTPGRVRADVAAMLHAIELLLDPPLLRDQLRLVEYSVRFPPGQRERHMTTRVQPGMRDIALHVRFDPARLPTRCVGFYQPTKTAPEQPIREHPGPDTGAGFQLIALDPPPGIYGVRWEWRDA